MTRASFEEPGPGAFEERDSKTPAEASAEEVHAYLGRVRSLVESKLDEVVPAEGAEPASVHAAMRRSLFAPAKRLRPVLVFAAGEAFGARGENLIRTACAFELIHTYSLIHDDLPAMDDDQLRRGRPTCHVAFGEGVAILAGDGLFAEAMRLVVEHQPGEPDRVLAALGRLVDAAGVSGMVGGQFIDVTVTDDLDPDHLRHLHELKTGRLIAASVECVIQLGSITGPATIALRRFAAELGVLFQIVDDILDVTGNEAS